MYIECTSLLFRNVGQEILVNINYSSFSPFKEKKMENLFH